MLKKTKRKRITRKEISNMMRLRRSSKEEIKKHKGKNRKQ
jgi:hypothetical protein